MQDTLNNSKTSIRYGKTMYVKVAVKIAFDITLKIQKLQFGIYFLKASKIVN